MTASALPQRVNETRNRATARITMFSRTLDGIRADRMLSEEGKRDKIAREYVAARHDLDTLRAVEGQAVQARKAELERVLFGWQPTMDPAVIRARRESNELADALDDPRDALTAYQTAKTRSDDLHVHAIFARALERGWQTIVADYLTERPAREAETQELAAIHRLLDVEGQFIASMSYTLTKPNELSTVTLSEYERELTTELSDVQSTFARQLRTV